MSWTVASIRMASCIAASQYSSITLDVAVFWLTCHLLLCELLLNRTVWVGLDRYLQFLREFYYYHHLLTLTHHSYSISNIAAIGIVMMMYALTFAVLSSATIISAYRLPSSHAPLAARYVPRRSCRSLRSSVEDGISTPQLTEQLRAVGEKKDLIHFSKSLPLHIYVDLDIRIFLKMKNSERKARILLPQTTASMTIQTLRDSIDRKFPSLNGQPYILRYEVPGEKISPRQFIGMANWTFVFMYKSMSAWHLPCFPLTISGSKCYSDFIECDFKI